MILKAQKHAVLGAMIFMAKGDVRYYLNGICFAPGKKLVSTDGHRMFIGDHETEGLNEDIIIKIIGQRFTTFDRLEIDTETGVVSYLNEFGVKVGLALAEVIDGKFPDWQRVIPNGNEPVSEIHFQAALLSTVEKVAKLYNPKWTGITLRPNGMISVAQFDINGRFGGTGFRLIPSPPHSKRPGTGAV